MASTEFTLIEGDGRLGSSPECDYCVACPDLPDSALVLCWDGSVLSVRPEVSSGFLRVTTAAGSFALATVRQDDAFAVGSVSCRRLPGGRLRATWNEPARSEVSGSTTLVSGIYEFLGSSVQCDHVITLSGFPPFAAKLLWDKHQLTIQPDIRGASPARVVVDGQSLALGHVTPGQSFEISGVNFRLSADGRLSYRATKGGSSYQPVSTTPMQQAVVSGSANTGEQVSYLLGPAGELAVQGLTHPQGVFSDLDFRVPTGRLVAIIGPSGAGKTSLFRTLLTPQKASGTVLYLNEPMSKWSTALVPQKARMIEDLKVRSVLHTAYQLKNRRTGRRDLRSKEASRISRALSLAGFNWTSQEERGKFMNKYCDTLSGGEEKRLSLALELLGAPDILLLDEPNSGLDPHTDEQLFCAMRTLVSRGDGVGILMFITHSLAHLHCEDWVLAVGTRQPSERPAHVAYCGPRGDPHPDNPSLGSGIYAEVRSDAELLERLSRSVPGNVIF